mmetsp:Transcript_1165/g.1596  ORF Transcript_1165/g.1596 Transcript_1165/m.1596 type:complete len:95 (-) Transcript_1165:188-472(-)
MTIASRHNYVNNHGEILAVPYLMGWKGDQCDLNGLVSALSVIFSINPPLFSISTGAASNISNTNRPLKPASSITSANINNQNYSRNSPKKRGTN